MIYRPLYVEKIMAYVDTPFVKILTGVRRCGKSTILKMIMERLKTQRNIPDERIVSCRYDSMEYEDMTAKQMYAQLKERLSPDGKTYLFLDEVQEIKGWEKVVNSLASDFDVDLYVTGSNSRMMSSEISTYLTGRYVSFRIFTLSFGEYLMFKSNIPRLESRRQSLPIMCAWAASRQRICRSSLKTRSTPSCGIFTTPRSSRYCQAQSGEKDRPIGTSGQVHLQQCGQYLLRKSISDYLKAEHRALDNETVYSYLEKLEKAYLLHRCSRFDLQGKEILKTQEKFYLADTALRYSVLGYNADSVASSLENVVYLELCRRGYTVNVGKSGSGEIDFVAVRQNEKLYVQVTQELRSPKTEKREYERLLEIHDNYPKYVLTTDEFSGGNYEGIKTMHIADFLLSSEY